MTEEAQSLLNVLLEERETIQLPLHEISLLYKALGQEDRALKFLVEASSDQSFIVNTSSGDPRWDEFREDPMFAEILEKIGVDD